jgi:glycosyltransferase involved in cell wall biosynthesis
MSPIRRLAFIGNSLPRHCGIATFTTDLQQAVASACPQIETTIVAMTDHGHEYEYPPQVGFQIHDQRLEDYLAAADFLNSGKFDAVCLQHEFGIFGGDAGEHVIALLARLTMPVITTLHTVLAEPSATQRRVMDRIVDLSARVVVMAEMARELLNKVYRVPAEKIEVIAHGIPDFDFVASDVGKAKMGFEGRTVLLTFGLLSPNKGIEVMIDAMPAVLASRPDAVYVVLGATHPNLVRHEGEAYRERLVARVEELGLSNHVVFMDRFVDLPTLLDFISMCDVYVTPYLNEKQMTSGTLAYSFGLGKPVVSTPYWHARELLADGRGVLVPFGDAVALGNEIASLLTDEERREAMQRSAYSAGREMVWDRTALRYVGVFESARKGQRPKVVPLAEKTASPRRMPTLPDMQLGHLMAMCDDTGLFQHAVHSVPDRSHGYCVDDNARALLLACALNQGGERRLPDVMVSRFAAFIQHAWNPDNRRFRNFMGFDRRWLEPQGSEDSHGRTLWALGECALRDVSSSRRQWARALFVLALPSVSTFSSPRAWAFTLLGLDAYCAAESDDSSARRTRFDLADRLIACLASVETPEWVWFEEGVSYDNARLSQALIVTGMATGVSAYTTAGLKTLSWLTRQQSTPSGHHRPIGSDSFGDIRVRPRAFDQQPLEAAATISACQAAVRAGDAADWRGEAGRAFAWFLGQNDLEVSLVDVDTGSCRDGLHPDRPNENRGGESVLSYLLGLSEMRQAARASGDRPKFVPRSA